MMGRPPVMIGFNILAEWVCSYKFLKVFGKVQESDITLSDKSTQVLSYLCYNF